MITAYLYGPVAYGSGWDWHPPKQLQDQDAFDRWADGEYSGQWDPYKRPRMWVYWIDHDQQRYLDKLEHIVWRYWERRQY